MSFKDIKGHDASIELLKNSIETDKVSHAYIFSGPAGIGKKLVAVNFAKALNCAAGSGEKPCDVCVPCKKIDSSNHPDIFIVKAEKEGSSLGIDKIREVITNIGLKPYEARKKIYIIDDAVNLTAEATNALLKTLEEPPSDSVIIFISESAGKLLPTIESRCQAIRFFPLGAADSEEVLGKLGIDKDRAGILARISSGCPGTGVRMNEKKFFENRSLILDGLKDGSFFDSDFDKVSKHEIRLYLDIILSWYRDALVAKTAPKRAHYLINIDRLDAVELEASRRDYDFLYNIIAQAILTKSFIDTNINPKLALGVLGANINEW